MNDEEWNNSLACKSVISENLIGINKMFYMRTAIRYIKLSALS